jgi:hypothetical protein
MILAATVSRCQPASFVSFGQSMLFEKRYKQPLPFEAIGKLGAPSASKAATKRVDTKRRR